MFKIIKFGGFKRIDCVIEEIEVIEEIKFKEKLMAFLDR